MTPPLAALASPDSTLAPSAIEALVESAAAGDEFRGARVLCIVPDATRNAPVGSVFKPLYRALAGKAKAVDVLVALGTHQPMDEAGICARLDLTAGERAGEFRAARFFNHEWDNPEQLTTIGEISPDEVRALSGGQFEMAVPVGVNRRLFGYDIALIIGPVLPHEVVGFSGGNKYLFPGVSAPEVLHFFHWLAALVTTTEIIGIKRTPVRRVIDHAASLVRMEKRCFCLVTRRDGLGGLFFGTPESAWDAAADLSSQLHIRRTPRRYHTIVSCAAPIYKELWVGSKAFYKLEPVLADGGELIICSPHITAISQTHGKVLREIGYHCRDYFVQQWDRFKHHPWVVLGHSTHTRGAGTYRDGAESFRAEISLATGIPESECRAVNLGFRDPARLRIEDFLNREDEGILVAQNSGERLYRVAER